GAEVPKPPRRYWQEMTSAEIAALEGASVVAILPLAAIEQHGPHLAVAVDAVINEGVLARTLELVPEPLPLTVLPALAVGRSDEHEDFPGTLSLSPETALRLWEEVADGVARAGIRKLVLFNSHGGQSQLLDIVGRRLRRKHGMLVVQVNLYRLWDARRFFDENEVTHGIHGGAVETSLMLHLRPDLVRRGRLRNFAPSSAALAKRYKAIGAHGRVPFSWLAQDLHSSGAAGDARLASAQRGRALLEEAATRLAAILVETARLPLATLKGRPPRKRI
ncbi:MAG TPA: creatininase family protein, partial [Alphaproteobacteria bacterium]|nr:creatininase family protein [Alphaproteobacteria bacterium]